MTTFEPAGDHRQQHRFQILWHRSGRRRQLRPGFSVLNNSHGGGKGVYGYSINSTGVYGLSNIGDAVYGDSTNGTAVHGKRLTASR